MNRTCVVLHFLKATLLSFVRLIGTVVIQEFNEVYDTIDEQKERPLSRIHTNVDLDVQAHHLSSIVKRRPSIRPRF